MQGVQHVVVLLMVFSPGNGENLAYKKPTWQSNTLSNYTSDKAVDGLYDNLTISGNQCAISGGQEKEVEWMVDLGSVHNIHTITIHYRTDGVNWPGSTFIQRFRGFEIYVRNRIQEEGALFFDFRLYDLKSVWSHTYPIQGRYVVYSNTRTGNYSHAYSTWAYLDLCEVIVEGCPSGFYGSSCSQPCPVNCGQCHLITGACLGGCTNGYTGHQCKEYTRQNLALRRPTSAKTPFNNEVGGWLVVDGKKNDPTFQSRACLVTQNWKRYAEWRVDLQIIRSIERIILYLRTDNVTWDRSNGLINRQLGFSITVSNTTNPRDGVVCFSENKHNQSTIPAIFDAECQAVGRYVFYSNKRVPDKTYPTDYSKYAFADLCEVEVYGCPILGYNGPVCAIPCMSMCKEHYLENLALGKPTWQTSTYGNYTSDKAVDGDKDLHYSHGHCTITPDIRQVAWWVNLEAIRDISYVVIYFRTDNGHFNSNNSLAGSPLGFSLYISNTTKIHGAALCFHDTKYTRDTIPETLNITCPYKGQYVIYYNERNRGETYPSGYSSYAYADLCEVEVFGCPVPVENQPGCSLPCPRNCFECHAGTGICKKCYGAYEGDICQYVKSMESENCLIKH